MTQATNNCHYISRFVTTPWEFGQRQLRVFDFDTDCFETKSSRSLFAGERINEPHVERWLKDCVEDPLGAIRARVARGDLTPLESDWKTHRAAMLMLWLQGGRTRTLRNTDAREDLSSIARMPEAELNGLARQIHADHDLRVISSPADEAGGFAPLYFPSAGLFPFIVRDAGCMSGWSVGFGMPLDIHCAMIATPKEHRARLEMSIMRAGLACWSVGHELTRKLLIPPSLYDLEGPDNFRAHLHASRAKNEELFALHRAAFNLLTSVYESNGLQVRVDGAGRLPPTS